MKSGNKQVLNIIPNSIKIDKNIYWGGDFDVLTELLNNQQVKETDIRFFLGYSGWSVNQLEDEVKETTWLILPNKYPNIFSVESDTFWKNQVLAVGGEYQIWANAPIDPALH